MSTVARSAIVERGPVSLGCGTLILIALIVLFFSNRGNDDGYQLKNEIDGLKHQVGALQKSIDDQAIELNRIEQSLRRLDSNNGPKPQPEAPPKE
jgi:hypothetical protein